MARPIKLEEIRPLIGNLSRQNYYQVVFGGLPGELRSYLSNRGVGSRFISESVGLLCYAASIPGASTYDRSIKNFSGVLENFATSRVYTPLDLQFYCDNSYRALKFVEHWQEFIVSGNGTRGSKYALSGYNYRLKYPEDYKSNATKIIKFEADFKRQIEYTFIGLYPHAVSSTPVAYGNGDITRVSCSFKYDRFIAGKSTSVDFARNRANNLEQIIKQLLSGDLLALIN